MWLVTKEDLVPCIRSIQVVISHFDVMVDIVKVKLLKMEEESEKETLQVQNDRQERKKLIPCLKT